MKIFMKNANLILKLDFEWILVVFENSSISSYRKWTDTEPEVVNYPIKLLSILKLKSEPEKIKDDFWQKAPIWNSIIP